MKADIEHRVENTYPLSKILRRVTQVALLLLALMVAATAMRLQIVIPHKGQATPILTLKDANLSGISADGRRIAVSPELGLDEVYDVATGRKLQTFRVPGSFGSQVSADGRQLLVFAPIDNEKPYSPACGVWLFDIDSGREIKRANTCVEYDGRFVGSVVLYIPNIEGRMSADLRFIAGEATPASLQSKMPSVKPGVWLWDIENQRLARTLGEYLRYDEGNSDVWKETKLTPDARVLAATRFNHKRPENLETVVWDVLSGRLLLRLPFASRWLALSDDGRRLVTTRETAVSDDGSKTTIVVTAQGQVIVGAPPSSASTAAPQRRPPTEIWDIPTGRRVSEIGADDGGGLPKVNGALSPDGKLLATASLNYVLVWDTKTGRLLAAQPHDEADRDRVRSVIFNGDGRYLVMSSMNEIVRVWRVADVLKEVE